MMIFSGVPALRSGFEAVFDPEDLRALYAANTGVTARRREEVLRRLGPLEPIYRRFLAHEAQITTPLQPEELTQLLDSCSAPDRSVEELLACLQRLAPGNGRVGAAQVNFLVGYLRDTIRHGLQSRYHGRNWSLLPHDHAFGSGGDFVKTRHATTYAALLAAPEVTLCKTGTTQVTSEHGSDQAARAIGGGYEPEADPERINALLSRFGFAFIPLAALGYPYSVPLKAARRRLWNTAMRRLETAYAADPSRDWAGTVRSSTIPLDIFKLVSPNLNLLGPQRHTTGVSHLQMLPYVLGIYLHHGMRGMIAHCYYGIDELCPAGLEGAEDSDRPTNLLVRVDHDAVRIAELRADQIGGGRARMQEIREEADVRRDAAAFTAVITGEDRGPIREFLTANAAVLIAAAAEAPTGKDTLQTQLQDAISQVSRLIDTGRAADNLMHMNEDTTACTQTTHSTVRTPPSW